MKTKIILAENRGDYITRLTWNGTTPEVHGGSITEATRYTASEAWDAVDALGDGYSVEDAPPMHRYSMIAVTKEGCRKPLQNITAPDKDAACRKARAIHPEIMGILTCQKTS